MLNREMLDEALSSLPLYIYGFIDPQELEFSHRIRHICRQECPMYGKTWACPPAVGSVEQCRETCLQYDSCLVIATVTEVEDIADIAQTLATRPTHEQITDQVAQMLKGQGIEPYILSTEACAVCEQCAYLEGKPCRFPERMHPCVESQGINVIPTLENLGVPFQYGENVVTWVSLLFFKD